jgi:hypothetical protein
MSRPLAFIPALVLFGAAPLVAQDHGAMNHPQHPGGSAGIHACMLAAMGGSHSAASGHDAGHSPATVTPEMRARHHRALQTCLTGTWKGAWTSQQGTTGDISLAIAEDAEEGISVRLVADRGPEFGAVSNLAVTPASLTWTQMIAGESCRVTAEVAGDGPETAGMLKGRAECAEGALAFSVRKAAE